MLGQQKFDCYERLSWRNDVFITATDEVSEQAEGQEVLRLLGVDSPKQ